MKKNLKGSVLSVLILTTLLVCFALLGGCGSGRADKEEPAPDRPEVETVQSDSCVTCHTSAEIISSMVVIDEGEDAGGGG